MTTTERARLAANARWHGHAGGCPKARARSCVQVAIRSGKLIRQPCEVCGSAYVVAHHDDYSKPLDVRWFCGSHHILHHKALGWGFTKGNKGRTLTAEHRENISASVRRSLARE